MVENEVHGDSPEERENVADVAGDWRVLVAVAVFRHGLRIADGDITFLRINS
jgi:hypothetical protein